MPYIVRPGYRSAIIDQDGNPIAEGTTTVAIADESIAGLTAVGGELFLFGGNLGPTNVAVGGVTHEVVCQAVPFDWSLGEPVPL